MDVRSIAWGQVKAALGVLEQARRVLEEEIAAGRAEPRETETIRQDIAAAQHASLRALTALAERSQLRHQPNPSAAPATTKETTTCP